MARTVDHINKMANPTSAALAEAATSPAPTPEDVVEALHQTMRGLRAAFHGGGRKEGRDLTHLDSRVLGFFARCPGATQKELALHSGRDKGQIARLIHGLKARGLLSATPDDADRRTLRIELTPAGVEAHRAQHARAYALAEQSAQALSEDERRTLIDLLKKMHTHLGTCA